jgi:hypothetical protein
VAHTGNQDGSAGTEEWANNELNPKIQNAPKKGVRKRGYSGRSGSKSRRYIIASTVLALLIRVIVEGKSFQHTPLPKNPKVRYLSAQLLDWWIK